MGQTIAVVSGKGAQAKPRSLPTWGWRWPRWGTPPSAWTATWDCGIWISPLCMTDRAVMDFTDVLAGYCTLADAAAPHPLQKNLYLLTGPRLVRMGTGESGGPSAV